MEWACAILSSVGALQYFSTLSHKRHDFRKTLLNIEFVFCLVILLGRIFESSLYRLDRKVMGLKLLNRP